MKIILKITFKGHSLKSQLMAVKIAFAKKNFFTISKEQHAETKVE